MVFEFFLKTRRKIKKFVFRKTDNDKKGRVNQRKHYLFKVVLALVVIGIVTFIYPSSSVYRPLQTPQEGEAAYEDIISPRNFQILKSPEEMEQDRQMIRANQPLILRYQDKVFDSVMVELKRFFSKVDSLNQSIPDTTLRLQQFALQFPNLSQESQIALSHEPNVKVIKRFLTTVLTEIYDSGFVAKADDLPLNRVKTAAVFRKNGEHILTQKQLLDKVKAEEGILSSATAKFKEAPLLAKGTYDISTQFLIPNLKMDVEETKGKIKEETSLISPYKGLVLKGERIIGKNEKVTKEHLEKLESLAYAEHESRSTEAVLPYVGRALFVTFVFLFLGLFLYFFKRKIFNNNPKLLMICLIILLEIFLSLVLTFKLGWPQYTIPVVIASLLLTILIDVEVGLVSTVALGLLLGVVHNFDFKLTFLTIVVGTLGCYSVKEVQKRYRFYRPMLYISFAYIVLIFFMEYLRHTSTNEILELCGIGLANGFLSILLSIGFLPIFESLFNITTDISLLELSDLNHPILKRLTLEAPGTYHHSIVLGNLVEAAAKEIGANTLLARVGSYYHDIGKIKKPEYFVENQMGAKSKHEKLAPTMSALILESHVKEGVELAEEYNLPDAIIDFIQEHHGTSVMTYFYSKALEQGATEEARDEFRYPGPRPRSRETGIVLLADAVEAASRTLEDPKPSRIKSLIRKIIMDKFEAGELDECPLTLKDLHAVEDSLLPILIGVFHPRIDYPEVEEDAKTD
ncbi:MAG TPA: HDIG domain-containing protein [candidate division Zixibacteria bacterium]